MDITESEIVEALYHIVRACEEQSNPPNTEAMDVDPGNSSNVTSARKDTPTVPSFLRCCVNYRITPPQLRLALRGQHSTVFSAPEHALVILRILIDWLQVWLNRDVMLSSGNKEQCERSQGKNGTNEVPELQKVRYTAQPRFHGLIRRAAMADCIIYTSVSGRNISNSSPASACARSPSPAGVITRT